MDKSSANDWTWDEVQFTKDKWFFFGRLEEISKTGGNQEDVSKLVYQTAKEFGKERTLELAENMKDLIQPVEIAALKAKASGGALEKMPTVDIDNAGADVKAFYQELKAGRNALTATEKNETLEVMKGFLEGKDMDISYYSLNDKQRAYMQYLNDSADTVSWDIRL